MQKFIRVTAIIALALLCLSLLLLICTLPFQQTLARLFNSSDEVLGLLPIFSWSQFVNCFLLTGCAILAVVFGGNRKGGIWLEIVVFMAAALALPLLTTALSNMQTILFGNIRGSAYVAALSSSALIAEWCMWPGNLGRCLMLSVCGMSIVYKRMSKKPAKATE